jgi:hypothetical protein
MGPAESRVAMRCEPRHQNNDGQGRYDDQYGFHHREAKFGSRHLSTSSVHAPMPPCGPLLGLTLGVRLASAKCKN